MTPSFIESSNNNEIVSASQSRQSYDIESSSSPVSREPSPDRHRARHTDRHQVQSYRDASPYRYQGTAEQGYHSSHSPQEQVSQHFDELRYDPSGGNCGEEGDVSSYQSPPQGYRYSHHQANSSPSGLGHLYNTPPSRIDMLRSESHIEAPRYDRYRSSLSYPEDDRESHASLIESRYVHASSFHTPPPYPGDGRQGYPNVRNHSHYHTPDIRENRNAPYVAREQRHSTPNRVEYVDSLNSPALSPVYQAGNVPRDSYPAREGPASRETSLYVTLPSHLGSSPNDAPQTYISPHACPERSNHPPFMGERSHGFDQGGSKNQGSNKSFKPEKYDGSGDWGDYIDHFEQVADWNRWSLQDKAAQLTMNLTGVARQAWCDSKGSQALNYENIKAILKQRFRPEGQEEAYKAEFRYKTRGKEESYLEFGHKLRRLAIRSFPRMSHESREDLIRDQFVQNLEGDMRRHVSLAHPKSLDQAITMASEYETISQSLRPVPPQKPRVVAQVSEYVPDDSTKVLVGELLDGIKQVSAIKESPPESSKTLVAELLDGIKQLVLPRVQGRKPRVPLEQVECYHCHEFGHYKRDCKRFIQKMEGKSKSHPLN